MDSGRPPVLRALSKRLLFGVGSRPYAWLTRQPVWRSHGAALVDFAGLAPERPPRRLADLGCGPGISAFGLAERLPATHLVGVDLSPEMIALARAYARHEPPHPAGLDFIVGDGTRLPLKDSSIDVVTGHSFAYLVGDDRRLGQEVARVLVPGGVCVFLEPSREPFPLRLFKRSAGDARFVLSMVLWRAVATGAGRFTPERFRSLFGAAGLETVAVIPTLDGLGLVGVGKKPER